MLRNRIANLIISLLFIIQLNSIYSQQKFFINLNDRKDDLFKVTLINEKLTQKNKIFQFASTAPGTYQTMDIGRFVKSFESFDKNGNKLGVKQISTNQWELAEPVKTAKIVYTVAETWDTPVEKKSIYEMCGSSIEDDHVFINGQCVLGYFHGMQKTPIKIKINFPGEWNAGTSLKLDKEGFYYAKDFDFAVDSPILLGKLTKASLKVEKTMVDIYTYSKTGKVTSDQIMKLSEEVLKATSIFTEGLPVDRYVFLFHFEGGVKMASGAWEHNYSSAYVMGENPLTKKSSDNLRSTVAHEFYHIITPLNIHSELIGNFNFEKPVMSKHIWFYEGLTEWASWALQLRNNVVNLDEYLLEMETKLKGNDNYNQNISLVELSLRSTELQNEYPNIYQKGAIVGFLIDIELLAKSGGKRGLREVINKLYKDYGVNKSFSEENFFNEFVKRTDASMKSFIEKYIKGTEKLPVKECFAKIGIDYKEFAGVDNSRSSLGFGIGEKEGKVYIRSVQIEYDKGVRQGDTILKVEGEEIIAQNKTKKLTLLWSLKTGESAKLTVLRNGQAVDVIAYKRPNPIKHKLAVIENASPEQIALRNAWLKNL